MNPASSPALEREEPARAHAPADDSHPFALIPAPLRTALERKGFDDLTEVQKAVVAELESDRDLRISSQTGSGKTVALGLAMGPSLLAALETHGPRGAGPRALIVVPTRELAMQVRDELDWLYRGVRGTQVHCVTGGTNIMRERQRLFGRPTILVGTPGRLLDHHRSGAVELDDVRQLVLDEADQMLDLGFRDDLEAILSATPPTRRTHLVSATFPRAVQTLADGCQENPLLVQGTAPGEAHGDIEHIAHRVFPNQRLAALVNLLLLRGGRDRTLVFVRTRMDTAEVAEQLSQAGFAAAPLSGDLAQRQRTRTLDAFRSGRVPVLVATDVAARGLDVQDVRMVVHMDPPFDAEIYTHRSGRTGRAGNKGRSVMLVPVSAERGVRRMLERAPIEVRWADLPTAEDVTQTVRERHRMELHRALDEAKPTPRQLEVADDLLQGRDPHTVVAGLLEKIGGGTCEPWDIEVPTPPRQRHERPKKGPHHEGANGGASRYATFEINWGGRDGANPKRILAHICRRGGITSADVGVIRVYGDTSTLEVAEHAAAAFADKASAPDRREPHLIIEPAREGASRGDEFRAPPPPRRGAFRGGHRPGGGGGFRNRGPGFKKHGRKHGGRQR